MSIRSSIIFSAVALHMIGVIHGQEPPKSGRVMTWVPPYAVSACKERLNQSFDGIGMKDGLTHLGLQFWSPTSKGGIELVDRFKVIDESTISEFRKWGDAHGVRIMLCVYNGSGSGWDWGLAMTAFEEHRVKFVEALVSETLRLKLDGIDIDLEGNGKLDESRAAFVRFIEELSKRLHAEGKELTVDSFAYKWNAPNQNWWPALLPHVDALHVMGYAETGAGAAEWQGIPVEKNLQWVVENQSIGIAIWDAQLKAPVWRAKAMWQAIAKIKNGAEQGVADQRPAAVESKPK